MCRTTMTDYVCKRCGKIMKEDVPVFSWCYEARTIRNNVYGACYWGRKYSNATVDSPKKCEDCYVETWYRDAKEARAKGW